LQAYVLVQTERPGEPLSPRLKTIPGILSAEDLTGAYDAIALVEADSSRRLMDDVITEIRRLPGVTRALPAPWIRSFDRSNSQPSNGDPRSSNEPLERIAAA
jgi:DNA-binding Lrp family transcriptional regulator